MSIHREVVRTVVCDLGRQCQLSPITYGTTAAEIRREAKAQGWLTVRIDGRTVDICPRCAKAFTTR